MVKVRIALPLAGILVVFGLTGCTPGSPEGLPSPSVTATAEASTPTASPDPTPTATADPIVTAAIIVDADSIAVVASDGSALGDIPFTTPVAEASEQLSGFLGAGPVVADVPSSGPCAGPYTTFDWEGFQLRSPPTQADGEFGINVRAPSAVGGVSLQLTDGLRVGSSVSDLAASPSIQDGWASDVYYFDVRGDVNDSSSNSNPYGGQLYLEAGAVLNFIAPVNYFYDC